MDSEARELPERQITGLDDEPKRLESVGMVSSELRLVEIVEMLSRPPFWLRGNNEGCWVDLVEDSLPLKQYCSRLATDSLTSSILSLGLSPLNYASLLK